VTGVGVGGGIFVFDPSGGGGGVLAGDVTGPIAANTVVAWQGVPVSAAAPAPGDVMSLVAGVWTPVPGAFGGTLQASYIGGNTISVTAANGVIAFDNAADATDVLSVDRTFAGPGVGIDLNMGPGGEAVTGIGLDVDMGSASTGNGIDVAMAAGSTGIPVRISDGVALGTRWILSGFTSDQAHTIATDNQATPDTGGFAITIQPGDGGGAVAGAGGSGGSINLNPGDGGAGAAAQLAGLGGSILGTGGSAGVAAGGGGVAGGGVSFLGGTGSAADALFAGGGGGLVLRGGVGGAATAAVAGGAGGSGTLAGGVGGAGSAAGLAGGGGALTIAGGAAGADGGGGGASGGNIALAGGAGTGVGTQGTITFSALGSAAPIPFNETGDVDLDPAFTATSVIGALNELQGGGLGSALTRQIVIQSGVTIAVGDCVAASAVAGRCTQMDANGAAAVDFLGICLVGGTGDGPGTVSATVVIGGHYTDGAAAFSQGPLFAPDGTGRPTSTPPAGLGDYVLRVGWAYSATQYIIYPGEGITL